MPNNDKSEAAKKMRSGNEEERSRVASEMGRSGGQARGGSQVGGNQGGGNRGGNQGGGRRKEMDITEAASILGRDDSTEEEKREAARILGREGGRNSRGGND